MLKNRTCSFKILSSDSQNISYIYYVCRPKVSLHISIAFVLTVDELRCNSLKEGWFYISFDSFFSVDLADLLCKLPMACVPSVVLCVIYPPFQIRDVSLEQEHDNLD